MDLKLEVRKIGSGERTQRYDTFVPNKAKVGEELAEFYTQLQRRMEQKKEYIVWEKVFGSLRCRERLEAVRRQCLDEEYRRHPFVYLEGGPAEESGVSGIALYTCGTAVRYLSCGERPMGTEYFVDGGRRVYLSSGAAGRGEETQLPFAQQFTKCVRRMEEGLQKTSLHCRDLVRSWFYLSHIDRDYPLFNTLRRELFDRAGVEYSASANELPASTCIEAKSPYTDCEVEFLCCDKRTMELRRIYNPDQNEADGAHYLHRPTFSRALLLRTPGFSELQISGTASIDAQGNSVHCNDPDLQIRRTLRNVGHLLHGAGMDYADVVSATCFFKRAQDAQRLTPIAREMGLPPFAHITVVGNVCRDDLLFELDGIALQARSL